jgi:DNA-binding response OmpR family regulator
MAGENNSKKILVIEDNEHDQKILKRHLVSAGFGEVDVVPTGEQGVKLAEEVRPDLVIIDTKLPAMDGFETCRKVKHIPKLGAKVIVMTGLIEAIDAGKAREAGADEYCAKTSDCAHLMDAIHRLMK